MGVSRSGSQAARKLQRLSVDLSDASLTQVKEASQIIKKNVEKRAPRRLRNVGRRGGARIGVRYNVGNFGGEPKSKVYAYGPFQLVERPTEAHRIPRETVGRGRRKRKNTKKVRLPSGEFRNSVKHPGIKNPKRPWRRGVMDSYKDVRNVLESTTVTILRRHL